MRPALAILVAFFLGSWCRANPPEAAADFKKNVQPILSKYCYDCHGDGEKKGNVSLDSFKSDAELANNHDLWWRVLKNVRAGIMPPRKREQPTAEDKIQLAEWIKYQSFETNPQSPDPGRVTIRRLNRVEYRNTIRDLTGVDFNTSEEFPPDDTGYGFDTIGDVLSISPLLLEKYIRAAETIVGQAVPLVGKAAPEVVFPAKRFHGEGIRGGERISFYKQAEVYTLFTARQEGEYELRPEVSVDGSFNFDRAKCTVVFKVDDKELLTENYQWQNHKIYDYELKVKLTAGEHRLSFALTPLTPPPAQPGTTSVDFRVVTMKVVGPMDAKFWKPSEKYTRIFPRPEPPTDAGERRAYAREVLGAFASRAFRRPVDSEMLDRLVSLAEGTYSQPGKTFEQGVSQAMVAVLASPRFLFRIEQSEPATADPTWSNVDEYSLASRLSYFIWSTMPDQELIDLAAKHELRKNLETQVKRMLSDEKSQALVQNFVGQWLQARDVDAISIDARVVLAQDAGKEKELQQQLALFRQRIAQRPPKDPVAGAQPSIAGTSSTDSASKSPATKPATRPADGAALANAGQGQRQFNRQRPLNLQNFLGRPVIELDFQLRQAMHREVEMYFDYVLHQDRSVLDFLDSDYTFVNAKLAKVYGIPNVTGQDMRRVELPKDSPRGGLLTMGSTLVTTSNPTRTSPVKRGQFILDNILGMPAPPPPANLPPLEASDKSVNGREPSFREVLEIHRDQALCRSCHSRMDPLGLSLENFNALGMWRDKERGHPIDASGQLLTGEEFHDAKELKKILVQNHREDFYRCLTEKLMTYALGRGLDYYDVETVDQIIAKLESQNGKFSALMMGIIESAPFQERRNFGNPPGEPERPVPQRVQTTPFNHETHANS